MRKKGQRVSRWTETITKTTQVIVAFESERNTGAKYVGVPVSWKRTITFLQWVQNRMWSYYHFNFSPEKVTSNF